MLRLTGSVHCPELFPLSFFFFFFQFRVKESVINLLVFSSLESLSLFKDFVLKPISKGFSSIWCQIDRFFSVCCSSALIKLSETCKLSRSTYDLVKMLVERMFVKLVYIPGFTFISNFCPCPLGARVVYLLVLFTIYFMSSTQIFICEKFLVTVWLYIVRRTPFCKNSSFVNFLLSELTLTHESGNHDGTSNVNVKSILGEKNFKYIFK